MSLDEATSAFIGRIYESAHDWEAWDAVARDLLKLAHGHALFVSTVDTQRRQYSSGRFYGPDNSAFLDGVDEFWTEQYALDPSLAWAAANPSARFCDTRKILPRNVYQEDAFFKWIKSRLGSTHWLIGYTTPEDNLTFGVSLHASADTGPTSPRDDRLFRMLFEHMDRAIRLAARPPRFESADDAIVLLDRIGQVVLASERAEALLDHGGPLTLRDRRLHAATPAETDRLDAAINSAIHALREGGYGGAVRLSRPGHGDLVATITPLTGPSAPYEAFRPAVLVRLVDQRQSARVSTIQQKFFEFTHREVEVADLLLGGSTPENITNILGISLPTVRNHLHALFHKTNTGRQTDLIRVLLTVGGPAS